MTFLRIPTLAVVISVAGIGMGQERTGAISETVPSADVADDFPELTLATQRGLAAKDRQDWPTAIKYFREALELAPGDPDVLLRSALAYDNGNRPLPAIAAFRAYLAAVPGAENAEIVRARIAALEVAVESQVGQLLRTAETAAELLPDSAEKSARLREIAEVYAKAANFSESLRVAAACPQASDRDAAFEKIASHQSRRREFTAALETAARIRDAATLAAALLEIQEDAIKAENLDIARRVAESIPDVPISIGHSQAFSLACLAELQARLDDLEGARLTIERIPADRRHRAYALGWVADAVGKAHPEAASELLMKARMAALNLWPSAERTETLEWIAGLQARWDDVEAIVTIAHVDSSIRRASALLYVAGKYREVDINEAALDTVLRALKAAEQATKQEFDDDRSLSGMSLSAWRCGCYRTAVEIQLAAGDVAAARESADRALRAAADQRLGIGNEHYLPDIAYAQARSGDSVGALQTAARIPEENVRHAAYDLVVKARCDAGDIEAASAIAERIAASDARRRSRAWSRIAEAYAKRHDLAAASEIAAKIQVAHAKADVYSLLARSYIQEGRGAEARDSLARAVAAAADISEEYSYPHTRSVTVRELAILQARLGDVEGARKTAAKISDVLEKLKARLWIEDGREFWNAPTGGPDLRRAESICDWVKLLTADPGNRWTDLDTQTTDWDRKLRGGASLSSSELIGEVVGAAKNRIDALTTVRDLKLKLRPDS
jgi:hypothetical protein